MNIHSMISNIIGLHLGQGCSSGSCLFNKPRGQATNGGCECRGIIASKILNFIGNHRDEFNKQMDDRMTHYE